MTESNEIDNTRLLVIFMIVGTCSYRYYIDCGCGNVHMPVARRFGGVSRAPFENFNVIFHQNVPKQFAKF